MKLATAVVAAALLLGGFAVALPAEDNAVSTTNTTSTTTQITTVPTRTRHHPRRDQVAKRLGKQNREIAAKESSGSMTLNRGNALDMKDKRIHARMEAMAAKNGGEITRHEQRRLDSELNDIARAIRGD